MPTQIEMGRIGGTASSMNKKALAVKHTQHIKQYIVDAKTYLEKMLLTST